MQRRNFLIASILLSFGLVSIVVLRSEGGAVRAKHLAEYELQITKKGFQKFVDPLPTLPIIKIPTNLDKNKPVEISMHLQQMKVQLHRDLPETLVWGYENSSPGPTIEVESGQALRIHWINDLPTHHFLPAATGMDMSLSEPLPDVRNVTHLHGAVVEQPSMTDRLHNNDGWPDAWTIPGQEQIADYPNQQSARYMLYHDHAVGTTGRNVAAGLLGLYRIRDDYERSLPLPSGDFEITLAFQARGLNADGSLYYSPNLSQEYYGNVVAVNGKLWPFLNVEPRKYRVHMINISNARSYDLKLVDSTNTSIPGPAFQQIGVDGGFLGKPAILNDPKDPHAPRLSLSPAERADVIIDFSNYAGKNLILDNINLDGVDGEMPVPQLMMIKVATQTRAPDLSELPSNFRAIQKINPASATVSRQISLSAVDMDHGMQMLLLNGKAWHDPLTEKIQNGSTEIWKLINTTTDMHPFHMHLVEVQILDRTPIDMTEFKKNGNILATGSVQPPDENEMGWKDVVHLPAGQMTRIIMRFNSYAGFYVYHCHILEHEDMDMMRPFQVWNP